MKFDLKSFLSSLLDAVIGALRPATKTESAPTETPSEPQ